MKFLVFLLALLNMLFYAYSQGYFGHPENPDAGRLERQVQADRMRIVSRGPAPAAPAKAPTPAKPVEVSETPAPVVAEEVQPEASKPAAAEKAEPVVRAEALAPVCLAWEQLSSLEAERLNALLAGKFPAFKVVRGDGNEANGWWVFIPPLADKEAADKRAAELRQFGVTDYFIIQEGPNRFAISLGIFSSEKGAKERLIEVQEKGVRSARLIPRPGKDGTLALQVTGPADSRAALVSALAKASLPKAGTCR